MGDDGGAPGPSLLRASRIRPSPPVLSTVGIDLRAHERVQGFQLSAVVGGTAKLLDYGDRRADSLARGDIRDDSPEAMAEDLRPHRLAGQERQALGLEPLHSHDRRRRKPGSGSPNCWKRRLAWADGRCRFRQINGHIPSQTKSSPER